MKFLQIFSRKKVVKGIINNENEQCAEPDKCEEVKHINPKISIIVAVDGNDGIGIDGDLLCHLPSDIKMFKQKTSGHTVIMGRKTWESLKIKPLPNRRNIVITSQKDYICDAIVVNSIDDAIKCCDTETENFIIGGASIYKAFLPYTDKIYITQMHHVFKSDTFFPSVNWCKEWNLVNEIFIPADDKNKYDHSFMTFERIRKMKLHLLLTSDIRKTMPETCNIIMDFGRLTVKFDNFDKEGLHCIVEDTNENISNWLKQHLFFIKGSGIPQFEQFTISHIK